MNGSFDTLVMLTLAVATAALINGLVGFGFALLAVNAMALVLGVKEAVVVMSLMAPVMSGLQLLHHRRHVPGWNRLRGLVFGALSGSLVGAHLLVLLPAPFLSVALGLFTVSYVAFAARADRPAISAPVEARLAPLAGFVGGVSNGTLGASGPVFGSYLTAIGLRGRDFAAAISGLFLSMGIARLVQLAALGQYDLRVATAAAVLLVPSVVLQRVGFWLRRRVSAASLYRGVLAILAVAGASLVIRGIAQLL